MKRFSNSATNVEETFLYGGDVSGIPMMKTGSVLASSVVT